MSGGSKTSNGCPERTRAVALHLGHAVERFEGSMETLVDVLRAVRPEALTAAEAATLRNRLAIAAGQLDQVVAVLGERAGEP